SHCKEANDDMSHQGRWYLFRRNDSKRLANQHTGYPSGSRGEQHATPGEQEHAQGVLEKTTAPRDNQNTQRYHCFPPTPYMPCPICEVAWLVRPMSALL